MAIDFDALADAEEAEVTTSINTTPLIDVLLVLLVMLIITIPIQLHSVNVEMPNGPPPANTPEPFFVKLEVTADNHVLWDGTPLADRAVLDERLRAAAQLATPPEIHIRAAATASYDSVAAVLSAAQGQGLQKVGLVGLEEAAR